MLYSKLLQRMSLKLSREHVDLTETWECLRLVYVKQGEDRKAESIIDEMIQYKSRYRERNSQPSFRKSKTDSTSRPYDQSLEGVDPQVVLFLHTKMGFSNGIRPSKLSY